jgi:hypothetical protein
MSDATPSVFTPEQINSTLGAAHTALICETIGMLIETGVLNQGYVVSRLEQLSKKMMTLPGAQYGVRRSTAVIAMLESPLVGWRPGKINLRLVFSTFT